MGWGVFETRSPCIKYLHFWFHRFRPSAISFGSVSAKFCGCFFLRVPCDIVRIKAPGRPWRRGQEGSGDHTCRRFVGYGDPGSLSVLSFRN